jgi:hypothetical protein
MRAFVTAAAFGAAVIAMGAGSGCGGGDRGGFVEDPPAQSGGASDAGGGGFGDVEQLPGCDFKCSTDLHHVVDCNGARIKTCGDDEGCGAGGKCVPACDAAKANRSTRGCEYYSVHPDVSIETVGACFAAIVANTWTKPVAIEVQRAGQPLDVSRFARIPSGGGASIKYDPLPGGLLPPGQVAVLFFSQWTNVNYPMNDIPCPSGITPATTQDIAVQGSGMTDAFRVKTSHPVVAYDIFPYGGGNAAATSASLLLPTSAWDVNYIGINAYSNSVVAVSFGARTTMHVVGSEDGTKVTVNPSATVLAGNGIPSTPKGVPQTYTVNRGQALQFSQPDELTGSIVQADKPVGVFGGANIFNMDPNTCCADSAHQQIPPIRALGSEYVAVRYRNRDERIDEAPPWRVVGLVDGTKLTYEPAAPPGAPASLDRGDIREFKSGEPFVVKSQDAAHPLYVAGYMTSCKTLFPNDDCRGDAEFVNVVPARQFLDNYVFFTDPTYPETNLVVVRTKHKGAFKDVTLDCAGPLERWQPVGTAGDYEYTRIDLQRHNFEKQGSCDNGRHEIKSDAPFGVTVWGWGSKESGGVARLPQAPGFFSQAVSYAYPAGMAIEPINQVFIPAIPK